ncbi:MAG: cytosine permease [Bryobacteraceae bacterium]
MEHRYDPSLYNHDLAPIPADRRTWSVYNYAALWVAMSVCIPTYMLASGLIAGGMSWKQAIGTIFLGNLIVLIPMILNAHAGAKYGIPFPVFVRASFGVRGANVAAVLRAIVACGWFGIQSWIGGQAIYSMLRNLAPGAAANSLMPWILFFRFLAAEYAGDLAWDRNHQVSGRDWRAVHVGRRFAAAVLDHAESGRFGPGAKFAR